MPDTTLITKKDFASKVKAKYPEYKDMNDDVLVEKMLAKYPEYKSQISDLNGGSIEKKKEVGGTPSSPSESTSQPTKGVTPSQSPSVQAKVTYKGEGGGSPVMNDNYVKVNGKWYWEDDYNNGNIDDAMVVQDWYADQFENILKGKKTSQSPSAQRPENFFQTTTEVAAKRNPLAAGKEIAESEQVTETVSGGSNALDWRSRLNENLSGLEKKVSDPKKEAKTDIELGKTVKPQFDLMAETESRKAADRKQAHIDEVSDGIVFDIASPDMMLDPEKLNLSKMNNVVKQMPMIVQSINRDAANKGYGEVVTEEDMQNPQLAAKKINDYFDKRIEASKAPIIEEGKVISRVSTDETDQLRLEKKLYFDKVITPYINYKIVEESPDANYNLIGQSVLSYVDPNAASKLKRVPNLQDEKFQAEQYGLKAKIDYNLAMLEAQGDKADPKTVAETNSLIERAENGIYDYPELRKRELRMLVQERLANAGVTGGIIDGNARQKAVDEMNKIIRNPPNVKDIPLLRQMADDLDIAVNYELMSGKYKGKPMEMTEERYLQAAKEPENWARQSYVERLASGFLMPAKSTVESLITAGRKWTGNETKVIEESGAQALRNEGFRPQKLAFKQPEVVIDGDKNSATYGQKILNPKAGEYQWKNMLFEATEGTGQLFGQMVLGGGISKLLSPVTKLGGVVAGASRSAEVVKNLETFNKVILPGYLMSYDQNVKQSYDLFGADENAAWKRGLYANTASFIEGAAEMWGNPFEQIGLAREALSAVKGSVRGVVESLSIKEIRNMTSETFQQKLASAAKVALKATLKGSEQIKGEMIEEVSTAIGQFGAASALGAQMEEGRTLAGDIKDAAVQTFAQMSLLGGVTAGGSLVRYSNSNLTKQAMFDLGTNPAQYRDAINKMLADGEITQEDANEKILLVNIAENSKKTWDSVKDQVKQKTGGNQEQLLLNGMAFVQARSNEMALNKKLNNDKTSEVEGEILKKKIEKWRNVQRATLNNDVAFDQVGAPVLPSFSVPNMVEVQATSEEGERLVTFVPLDPETGEAREVVAPIQKVEGAETQKKNEENRALDLAEIDDKISKLTKEENPLYEVQKERLEKERSEINDYYDNYSGGTIQKTESTSEVVTPAAEPAPRRMAGRLAKKPKDGEEPPMPPAAAPQIEAEPEKNNKAEIAAAEQNIAGKLTELAKWRDEQNANIRRIYQDNSDPDAWVEPYNKLSEEYNAKIDEISKLAGETLPYMEKAKPKEVAAPAAEPIDFKGVRDDDFVRKYMDETEQQQYAAAEPAAQKALITSKKEQLAEAAAPAVEVQPKAAEAVTPNSIKSADGINFKKDDDRSLGENDTVLRLSDEKGGDLGFVRIINKGDSYSIENINLNKENTGLGTKLYTALSKALDKPISSGSIQNDKAIKLWDRLVSVGIAEKTKEGYITKQPAAPVAVEPTKTSEKAEVEPIGKEAAVSETPIKDKWDERVATIDTERQYDDLSELKEGDVVLTKTGTLGFVKKINPKKVIIESSYGGMGNNDIEIMELSVNKGDIQIFKKPKKSEEAAAETKEEVSKQVESESKPTSEPTIGSTVTIQSKTDKTPIKYYWDKGAWHFLDSRGREQKETAAQQAKITEEWRERGAKMADIAEVIPIESEIDVERYIDKAQAVLTSLFPDAKLVVYETEAEYLAAGGTPNTRGEWNPADNTVALNLERMRADAIEKTPVHEVIHPIIRLAVNADPKLEERLVRDIQRFSGVKGMDTVLAHAAKYKPSMYGEELITEFVTRVVDGTIDLGSISPDLVERFLDLVNRVFGKIGLPKIYTISQLKGIAAAVQKAFDTGDVSDVKKLVSGEVSGQGKLADKALSAERAEIERKAKADGTWLKSPSGKPTNLTAAQWVTVRTENFKNWFGDWLNDPENASKVVDENGEPLVVYHGTQSNKFDTFRTAKNGIHFGTMKQTEWFYPKTIYEVFLNIRNLKRIKDRDSVIRDRFEDEGGYSLSEKERQEVIKSTPTATDVLGVESDGGVYINEWEGDKNEDSFVVLNPNQIKSATDNLGTFSPESANILQQLAPEFESEIADILDEFSDATVDEIMEEVADSRPEMVATPELEAATKKRVESIVMPELTPFQRWAKRMSKDATEERLQARSEAELSNVFQQVFGLSKEQGDAAAKLADLTVQNMAKAAGISVAEQYDRLSYGQRAKEIGDALFQTEGWHGSPYAFDKFTTDKIGTGEGAQAFGYGLYFSDLKGIAEGYARALTPKDVKVSIDGVSIFDNPKISKETRRIFLEALSSEEVKTVDDVDRAIYDRIEYVEKAIKQSSGRTDLSEYHNELGQLYDAYELVTDKLKIEKSNRNLYKVTLHKGKTPEQYEWLEWDKPFDVGKAFDLLSKTTSENSKVFSDYLAARSAQEKVNKEIRLLEREGSRLINENNATNEQIEEYSKRNRERKRELKYTEVNQKAADLYNKLRETRVGRDFTDRVDDGLNGGDFYGLLSDILGGDKEASLFLLENGIDGVKYPAESIARGATSDNARGFNYVVFDENAVTIEERIQFQNEGVGAQGAIVMKGSAATILAMTNPNVTTPLHEHAHAYFDVLLNAADNAQAQADVRTTMKEAGVALDNIADLLTDKEAYTKTHEYFARGFEKFLYDGVAPTPELKSLFEKFREWLLDIYKELADSPINIQLNDAMREVYGRMLSPEQVAKDFPKMPEVKVEQKNVDLFAKIAELDGASPLRYNGEMAKLASEYGDKTVQLAVLINKNFDNITNQLDKEGLVKKECA